MSELERITLEPNQPAQSCIIWLHGLGADGHDFEPLAKELELNASFATRFIFPHAPFMPVSINNGMKMRAWYDITMMDLVLQEDQPSIEESSQAITALIDEQIASGIPADKIILAGFSQGGAITLHAGLRYPKTLGGLIALSCYLPLKHTFSEERHEANAKTNIFMAHGLGDPVVPYVLGEASKAILLEKNYQIDWHAYNMLHQVCPEEVLDLKTFITNTLAA